MLSHGKTSDILLENKLQNNMYSVMSSAWGVGEILYYLYIDETAARWVRKAHNKLTSAVLVEKGAGRGAFILSVLPECCRRVCPTSHLQRCTAQPHCLHNTTPGAAIHRDPRRLGGTRPAQQDDTALMLV